MGRLTPPMRDLISSLGERLSAPLVAAALAVRGVPSEAIEATELVVTDSYHGAAEPRMDQTRGRCSARLNPLLRHGVTPVVTGFIGATEDGVLTTLGRGGSDYSATILGAALEANEVTIWTDVDGMLTADPHLVPDASTIPEISYREAAELAYFGAKVLHPKTLRPVMQCGIPVWIRNTFAPDKPGTRITPHGHECSGGVKALTAVTDAAIINVGGAALGREVDVVGRALATMAAVRTDVLMVAHSPSRDQVCLVVAAALAERTVAALRSEFAADVKHAGVDHVSLDSTVSILTVVGEDQHVISGIIGRALDELARANVDIIASAHGVFGVQRFFRGGSRARPDRVVDDSSRIPKQPLESSARQSPGSPTSLTRNAIQPRTTSVSIKMIPNQDFSAGEGAVNLRRSNWNLVAPEPVSSDGFIVLDEISFQRMIALERRRTERSRNPVLLMLLDLGKCLSFDKNGAQLSRILSALSLTTRDTDLTGWYKDRSVMGVMFTEISPDDDEERFVTMMNRVSQTLRNNLSPEIFSQIGISVHVFPEDWEHATSPGHPALYPDLAHREKTHRVAFASKRVMDVVGSLVAIVLFAPLFLAVAVLVKLGSKGPILFKQQRVGQFGELFTFLKFRSMYANNDPKIHREFMKRVISGGVQKGSKMTDDPRITRVGRIIRKTSLDELPQFFSVLKGDMSLVGPRPPLEYECREYDIWHRRRVLEVKPGLTGLWQVMGRSRVRFDEMVRLDLQYVRTWSLWLDIKILLKTPLAVILGGDAF